MITSILWLLALFLDGIDFHGISTDTEAIALMIGVASDLNLLLGGRK